MESHKRRKTLRINCAQNTEHKFCSQAILCAFQLLLSQAQGIFSSLSQRMQWPELWHNGLWWLIICKEAESCTSRKIHVLSRVCLHLREATSLQDRVLFSPPKPKGLMEEATDFREGSYTNESCAHSSPDFLCMLFSLPRTCATWLNRTHSLCSILMSLSQESLPNGLSWVWLQAPMGFLEFQPHSAPWWH